MSAAAVRALVEIGGVLLPALMAACMALPRLRPALTRLLPWAALPALAAALWPAPGGEVVLEGVLLGARLGLDETGRGFLLVTALVWLAAGWFGRGFLAGDRRPARLAFFWLVALAGNVALVLAQDMVTFYTGFAVMSFSAYGLVVHDGTAASWRAGRVYLALVVAGEVLLFCGLVLIAPRGGSVGFPSLDAAPMSGLAAWLLLLGFGAKAGLLPLHVSLPLAYPAAPLPAAAALGGAMLNAGLLGWLRFLPAGIPGVAELAGVLVAAGLAAAFLGALVGVTQTDARALLAYSSISQVGLMTVGMGAAVAGAGAAPAAVTLYALHHGLAKAALFLGLGVVGAAVTGEQRRLRLAALLLPALALAGAPWTSGAAAKMSLKASVAGLPAPWPVWLAVLLPLAAVGTTVLMARFLQLAWRQEAVPRAGERVMLVAWSALLAAVASVPWLWVGGGVAAREAFAPATVLALVWPIALGALLAWIGAGRIERAPRVPAGDLLVLLERAVRRRRGDGLL